MLNSLDQWAFQVLMVVYAFLGVKDIPDIPDENWKVVERWQEVEGGYYRLRLESEALAKDCNSNRSGYVIFPQVYMAKQEIYVDHQIVYTNAMSDGWDLVFMLGRPVVSCNIFLNAKQVSLVTTSYMKYFSSFKDYPQVVKAYPKSQIFYEEAYIISAVGAIFVGIVSFFMIKKVFNVSAAFIHLLKQLSVAMLAVSHMPGKFLQLSIWTGHTLTMLGMLYTLIGLVATSVGLTRNRKVLSIVALLVLQPIMYVTWGYKNLTHVVMMAMFPSTIIISLWIFFCKLRSKKKNQSYLQVALYFLLFISVTHNILYSQIYRDGFLHLSIISILISTITYVNTLGVISEHQLQLAITKETLKAELRNIKKMRDVHLSYKEFIHDIKAPLTTLMFFLKNPNLYLESINIVVNRFTRIINRIESDNQSNLLIDSYSLIVMIETVKQVVDEKSKIYEKFHFIIPEIIISSDIICDPVDFIVVIEEVLSNTIKYSDGKAIMNVDEDDKYIYMKFISRSSCLHYSDSDLNYLSTTTGLKHISKKMRRMYGDVVVSYGDEFCIILIFSKKNKNLISN